MGRLNRYAAETGILPLLFDDEPQSVNTTETAGKTYTHKIVPVCDPDKDETDEVKRRLDDCAQKNNAKAFLEKVAVRLVTHDGYWYLLRLFGNRLMRVDNTQYVHECEVDVCEKRENELMMHALHVTRTGKTVVFPVLFSVEKSEDSAGIPGRPWDRSVEYIIREIKVFDAVKHDRIYKGAFLLQDKNEIMEIYDREKPYVSEFLRKEHFDVCNYVSAPWMETLSKAGYRIADSFLRSTGHMGDYLDMFNRLCTCGTKPKDIFKTPKSVYSSLKDCESIKRWNLFRIMEKKGKVDADSIALMVQNNYTDREIEDISSILEKKYDEKRVFTVKTLANYIRRLDMYEAIDAREAVVLLRDYLNMCNQLKMEPNIDGDSLKREHDIAARLIREQRNRTYQEAMRKKEEEIKKAIEEGRNLYSKLDYKEHVYFIRRITEYDDLADEAAQQHNCVLSYAPRIADGSTIILTMRLTAEPEKSYVTVELSPDCRTVRQKYFAFNQPIRNKSVNEFIERWHRQIFVDTEPAATDPQE